MVCYLYTGNNQGVNVTKLQIAVLIQTFAGVFGMVVWYKVGKALGTRRKKLHT